MTINNYNTAIDNGTDTVFIQSGLTCDTPYTLYVWAYNNCGKSATSSLIQNTSQCFICGTSTVTFSYHGTGSPSVTYGSVVGQNATCWLDRNLGAIAIASAYNHSDAYGDLFQWGRLDDGHLIRTTSLTSRLSNTDVPGHSRFIYI